MRVFLLLVFWLSSFLVSQAQSLFVKTYGNPHHKPLIFLHGGPGNNALSFEATTAQRLADKGFYVLVYDRRGEGRSVDPNAAYTFQQTFDDLNQILKTNRIGKVTLLGASFGGLLAVRYAEKYPEHVQNIVLIGALVTLQDTYSTIISSSRKQYEARNDTASLAQLKTLETSDRSSYDFRSACFQHASRNGFFDVPNRTEEAQRLYAQLQIDTTYQGLQSRRNSVASKAFHEHEHYSTIDNLPLLLKLKARGIGLYAIYGKDDGLYSPAQVEAVQRVTGSAHLRYLDRCAHAPFLDQQTEFVNALTQWLH